MKGRTHALWFYSDATVGQPATGKDRQMPHQMLAFALAALLALLPATPGWWPLGAGVAQADDDDGGDDDGDDDGDDGPGPGRGDRGDRGDRRATPAARAPQQRQPASPGTAATVPDFAPAEIVALGLGPGDVAVLLALGYRVLDDRPLVSLGGLRALRLAVPPGQSLEVARNEIRRVAPGAAADFNHFYRSEQGPGDALPDCNGPACGPRSQIRWPFPRSGALPGCDPGGMIGMIDTGVDDSHTALQGRAEVVRLDPGLLRASGDLHGTGVAALLVGAPGSQTPGLLPGTRLLAVDAFHKDGADERAGVLDLLTGLDLLFARGVRVVNLSQSATKAPRSASYCSSPPSPVSFQSPCRVSIPASTSARTKGKVIRFSRLTSTACFSSARGRRSSARSATRSIAGAQDIHPAADKAGLQVKVGRAAAAHVVAALHAAAVRMAQHHQMRDLQRAHRIFHRRRGAVVFAVGIIGRHQIGDVAVDEELALVRAEDRGDMHPAVAAGDHHGARVLAAAGQLAIPRLVVLPGRRPPAVKSLHQIGGA
jgi:hypothetical protein